MKTYYAKIQLPPMVLPVYNRGGQVQGFHHHVKRQPISWQVEANNIDEARLQIQLDLRRFNIDLSQVEILLSIHPILSVPNE